MNKTEGKRPLPYAWLIALACFCVQGGGLGIVQNCRGLFFHSLTEEFSAPLSAFTGPLAVFGLASMAAMPLVARCLERSPIRRLMGVSAVAICLAELAQAFFTAPWQWYAASAVQGVCYSFLVPLTLPLLVKNWFQKGRGFVLGLVGTASGFVGAGANFVVSRILAAYGWRAGYLFLAAALTVLTVPFCCFVVRLAPADAPERKLAPASGRDTASSDALRRALRGPVFWRMLAFAALAGFLSCVNQLMAEVGLDAGFSTEQAGNLTVVAMLGSIAGKLLLGLAHDRLHARRALLLGTGLVALGFALLLTGRVAGLYTGAALLGVPMAITIVLLPAWTLEVFGEDGYARIYTYISLVMNCLASFGYLILSGLLSWTGHYGSIFLFGLGCCAAMAILVLVVSPHAGAKQASEGRNMP